MDSDSRQRSEPNKHGLWTSDRLSGTPHSLVGLRTTSQILTTRLHEVSENATKLSSQMRDLAGRLSNKRLLLDLAVDMDNALLGLDVWRTDVGQSYQDLHQTVPHTALESALHLFETCLLEASEASGELTALLSQDTEESDNIAPLVQDIAEAVSTLSQTMDALDIPLSSGEVVQTNPKQVELTNWPMVGSSAAQPGQHISARSTGPGIAVGSAELVAGPGPTHSLGSAELLKSPLTSGRSAGSTAEDVTVSLQRRSSDGGTPFHARDSPLHQELRQETPLPQLNLVDSSLTISRIHELHNPSPPMLADDYSGDYLHGAPLDLPPSPQVPFPPTPRSRSALDGLGPQIDMQPKPKDKDKDKHKDTKLGAVEEEREGYTLQQLPNLIFAPMPPPMPSSELNLVDIYGRGLYGNPFDPTMPGPFNGPLFDHSYERPYARDRTAARSPDPHGRPSLRRRRSGSVQNLRELRIEIGDDVRRTQGQMEDLRIEITSRRGSTGSDYSADRYARSIFSDDRQSSSLSTAPSSPAHSRERRSSLDRERRRRDNRRRDHISYLRESELYIETSLDRYSRRRDYDDYNDYLRELQQLDLRSRPVRRLAKYAEGLDRADFGRPRRVTFDVVHDAFGTGRRAGLQSRPREIRRESANQRQPDDQRHDEDERQAQIERVLAASDRRREARRNAEAAARESSRERHRREAAAALERQRQDPDAIEDEALAKEYALMARERANAEARRRRHSVQETEEVIRKSHRQQSDLPMAPE